MRIKRDTIRLLLVYAVLILFLSQLQVTLPDSMAIMGRRPDLTLVLVILAGYLWGRGDGLATGLAAGFLRDLFAGRALGVGMLLLMYIGLMASITFGRRLQRHLLFGLVQVVWLTVIYEVVITVVALLFPVVPEIPLSAARLFSEMSDQLPGQLLANLAAALPLAFLLYYAGPRPRNERLSAGRDRERVRV